MKLPRQDDEYSPSRRRARKNTPPVESDAEVNNTQEASSEDDESLRRRRRGNGLSDVEKLFRQKAFDFDVMFSGHCNTTTDIKEANFFGDNYIVAGSDDGHFFAWDRTTTNVVRMMTGDESIVNCLQPAPNSCMLATSGIDRVVRLWTPWPDDGRRNPRLVAAAWNKVAEENQKRMNEDPLQTMLQQMGYRLVHNENDDDDDDNMGDRNGTDDDEDDDDIGLNPRRFNSQGRIGCATS